MDSTMFSKSAYEQNMKVLRARYPGAAHLVDRVSGEKPHSWTEVESKTGQPTGYVENDEGSARWLHSKHDPVKESKRKIAGIQSGSDVVLLGVGLGYDLFEISKRNDLGRLVVVERFPEMFSRAIQAADFTGLFDSDNFELVLGYEYFALYAAPA